MSVGVGESLTLLFLFALPMAGGSRQQRSRHHRHRLHRLPHAAASQRRGEVMNEPIPDDKPYAVFVFNHEGRQYVAREDYEWLRAEVNKQAKQIADAAYRLQGFPVGSPGYEAHAILCGEPPAS